MATRPRLKGLENQKARLRPFPREKREKANKGKKGDRSLTPTPSSNGKGREGKKGSGKSKPALTQGKPTDSQPKAGSPIGTASTPASTAPGAPQPKSMPSEPGKIPRQCAYFASPNGCQRGAKCMYLHEMEAGKPKPALPGDVAKLEARAKSNPSLRPPSKPPVKPASPAGVPTVKMV